VHPDPAISLMRAESQALRSVIQAALGEQAVDLRVQGSLTLLTLDEQLDTHGASVALTAHVKLGARSALGDNEKKALHTEALKEHRSLQAWARAIASLEHIQRLNGESAAGWTEMGELYGYAGQHLQAADACAKAAALEPAKLDHLRCELDAAKRIPDEERVRVLTEKLRSAEDEAKKLKQAKPQPPADSKAQPKAEPSSKSKAPPKGKAKKKPKPAKK
jgi:tetratricopeptide (TPR) repeat protein